MGRAICISHIAGAKVVSSDLLFREPGQIWPLTKPTALTATTNLAHFTGFPCLQMLRCPSLPPLPPRLTARTQDLHWQPLPLCNFKMPAYTPAADTHCHLCTGQTPIAGLYCHAHIARPCSHGRAN